MDEVDKVVRSHGQPLDVWVRFMTARHRTVDIETRVNNRIAFSVDNLADPPEVILDAIEPSLELVRLSDTNELSRPATAFIAHSFDEVGSNAANELARFLSLVGLRCYSGRAFAPTSVSEKVKQRMQMQDLFFAIVTPHSDQTWITQEISTAAALSKPVFILKQTDVDLKTGILGDFEYIPFGPGNVSRSFIPILEGIQVVTGRETRESSP